MKITIDISPEEFLKLFMPRPCEKSSAPKLSAEQKSLINHYASTTAADNDLYFMNDHDRKN